MNNFEKEVKMNRPRMALMELLPLLEDLNDRVKHLEAQLGTSKAEDEPKIEEVEGQEDPKPAKKAAAKKPAAKKAAADKK